MKIATEWGVFRNERRYRSGAMSTRRAAFSILKGRRWARRNPEESAKARMRLALELEVYKATKALAEAEEPGR